jgi:hypothetical protein
MDSINGRFSVAGIHINNIPIPDFSEDSLEYVVELDDTITIMPGIVVTGEDQVSQVNYPGQLPGEAVIYASSRDRVNAATYKVYLSQDSAYWDADLYMIITNWLDTLLVTPGIYSYDVTLPQGDTRVRYIKVIPRVQGQKFSKQNPTEYPGIATVVVTALDGVTTRTYELNVSLAVGLRETKANYADIQAIISSLNHFLILNQGDEVRNAEISIFDLNGRLLSSEEISYLAKGINETGINISGLNKGIYMYSLQARDRKYTGKFIKAAH